MGTLRRILRVPGVVLWTLPWTVAATVAWLASLGSRARFARTSGRVLSLWSRGMLKILGVRVEARGDRPRRGEFAVSNHLGHLDILVLASLYPTNFIAKVEIARWPVVGALGRLVATLWIDRKQARDTVRLGQELHQLLERGVTITMFPEGQAWRGDEVLPFKPPLFETAAALQVPVVPIAVTYRTPGPAGEDDGHPARLICWWQGESLVRHYWRMMGLRRIVARVRFAAAVSGLPDRKAMAAETHRRVAAMFEPVPR